ncbi:MAG: hypothetical protein JRN15_10630 [Nitrososphaerota archaeon]|nr:hypothetical protein [Nitrososphaerota archaeon]
MKDNNSKKKLFVVIGVVLVVVVMIGVADVAVNSGFSPVNHIRLAVVPAQDVKNYTGLPAILDVVHFNQSDLPFAMVYLSVSSGIVGEYHMSGNATNVNAVLQIYSIELQNGTGAKQLFDTAWNQYNMSAMIMGGYTPHSNGTYRGFRFFVGSVPYQDAGQSGVSYESVGFNGQYVFAIVFIDLGSTGPSPGFPQAEINAMLGA